MDEGYCIYLRKSREDKELEKYDGVDTLSRHRKALTELAEKKHLIISKIYEEVVSADTIEARPKMKELLSDVEDGKWNGVLVMEVERLARGETTDQGIVAKAFKYSSTKIITPSKTYDPNNEFDEEYFEFGLFMSRREYKTINRRLNRGREASVKEGKYVGNRTAYGYIRKKLDNEKGFTLEEKQEEAEIIQLIFKLYAYENYSIAKIQDRLNLLGYRAPKGGKWTDSTLRGMLSNEVYIGKIKWGARKQKIKMKDGKKIITRPRNPEAQIYDGLHKPIIDEATWNVVQSKRKQNVVPVAHNDTVKNVLAGIVYCKDCGRPMQRRPYNKKGKEPTLMCNNPECNNISSKLYIVEEQILNALANEWLTKLKFNNTNKTQNNNSEIELIKQYKKCILKEKERLNAAQEYLEDGTYTKEEYLDRSKRIKENISALETEKNKLEELVQNEKMVQNKKEKMISNIQNLLDIYNKLETAEEKNKLLKTVIQKVEYKKTEKAIKKDSDPYNFELYIYTKIPES